MYINKEKAAVIFGRLHQAYTEKIYPFDQPEATPPQVKENLPPMIIWGSKEHACFLFALCYWMRGGIDSHTATRQLTKLYHLNPNLFKPEFGPTMNTEAMSFAFKLMGLGFNAEEIAGHWRNNWLKVCDRWDGDPRNIFTGVNDYEEAVLRIKSKGQQGFKGFQEKMVSMLTYFYMDASILDRWNFPIPVDFHVLRTVFANEIVIAEASEANSNGFYTKGILEEIRKLFMWYCTQHAVDPITLCEAVWLHSRIMCSQQPGNQSKIGKRNGRKTIIYEDTAWGEAQTRTYEQTCDVCVVKETCTWCVPSAEYYIGGKIILRRRREPPPQAHLFIIRE